VDDILIADCVYIVSPLITKESFSVSSPGSDAGFCNNFDNGVHLVMVENAIIADTKDDVKTFL